MSGHVAGTATGGGRGLAWSRLGVILCGVIGIALTALMARGVTVIGPRPWYDSFWLPIVAAVVVFGTASALRRPLPSPACGLLLTGPPYLWFGVAFLRGGEYQSRAVMVLGVVVIACLASAGIMIQWLVGKVAKGSGAERTESM